MALGYISPFLLEAVPNTRHLYGCSYVMNVDSWIQVFLTGKTGDGDTFLWTSWAGGLINLSSASRRMCCHAWGNSRKGSWVCFPVPSLLRQPFWRKHHPRKDFQGLCFACVIQSTLNCMVSGTPGCKLFLVNKESTSAFLLHRSGIVWCSYGKMVPVKRFQFWGSFCICGALSKVQVLIHSYRFFVLWTKPS